MIRLNEVSVVVDQFPILRDINLTIKQGEFLALVGANGAGKTTLSRVIRGLVKPTQGSVFVAGTNLEKVSVSSMASTIGFLFQNPDRQICKQTVKEEIMFGLSLVHKDEISREETCNNILEKFKLDGGKELLFMSRGERQKVALASVVATNPNVVLLDEPTTGIDEEEALSIMQYIESLNKLGITIVMISHDMNLVHNFATRIVEIEDGRIKGERDN